MTLHTGVHAELEQAADQMLRHSLGERPYSADRGGILTSCMQASRRAREVQAPCGTPDPALRKGLFRRSYNPHRPELNSRDGIAATQRAFGPLQAMAHLGEELPGPEREPGVGWGWAW